MIRVDPSASEQHLYDELLVRGHANFRELNKRGGDKSGRGSARMRCFVSLLRLTQAVTAACLVTNGEKGNAKCNSCRISLEPEKADSEDGEKKKRVVTRAMKKTRIEACAVHAFCGPCAKVLEEKNQCPMCFKNPRGDVSMVACAEESTKLSAFAKFVDERLSTDPTPATEELKNEQRRVFANNNTTSAEKASLAKEPHRIVAISHFVEALKLADKLFPRLVNRPANMPEAVEVKEDPEDKMVIDLTSSANEGGSSSSSNDEEPSLWRRAASLRGKAPAGKMWVTCAVLHGGMSEKERKEQLDRFREDPSCMVLLMSTKLGRGLNLARWKRKSDGSYSGADTAVMLNQGYNPAEIRQALERIVRLSQLRRMLVVKMFSTTALELAITELNRHKTLGAQRVLERGDAAQTAILSMHGEEDFAELKALADDSVLAADDRVMSSLNDKELKSLWHKAVEAFKRDNPRMAIDHGLMTVAEAQEIKENAERAAKGEKPKSPVAGVKRKAGRPPKQTKLQSSPKRQKVDDVEIDVCG